MGRIGGRARLAGALLLVAIAAFADGAVEHRWGGAVLVGVAVLGAGLLVAGRVGAGPRDRLVGVGVYLLAGLAVVQALPWPGWIRAWLAPGQSDWLARVAGPELGEGAAMDAWADTLATYELDASIEAAARWTHAVPLAATDVWNGWPARK